LERPDARYRSTVATGFEASSNLPRATRAIARIAALVLATGTLVGLILIAAIGGTFVAISSLAH
jgi:hypothetical protein